MTTTTASLNPDIALLTWLLIEDGIRQGEDDIEEFLYESPSPSGSPGNGTSSSTDRAPTSSPG